MRFSNSVSFIIICLALMAAAFYGTASAQSGLNAAGEPAYGTRAFVPGFAPPQFSIDLVSGGANDVTSLQLGDNCLGYAAEDPDFVVELADDFERITILVDSRLDTTLIVNTPNGSWACNDDTNGLNPAVVLRDAAAGQYQIWIGSYEQDASGISTLWVTEDGPEALPTTSTGPDRMQLPTWGEFALSPGFDPADHAKQVMAGGRNLVTDFVAAEGCAGYVAEAPDFSFTLSDAFEEIWFSAHSPANITMLLNAADGEWHCRDDFLGTDPSISFSDAAAGRYDIWIGSYEEDNYAASIVYVTESAPDESIGFNINTHCSGLLPTDLQVGFWALAARADGEALDVHSAPNSGSSQVFEVENDTRVELVGGPVCTDDHRWWRIALFDAPRGWVPDGDASEHWLQLTTPPVNGVGSGNESGG